MLGRLWRAAANNYSRAVPGRNNFVHAAHFYPSSRIHYSDVAAAVDSAVPDPTVKNFTAKTDVSVHHITLFSSVEVDCLCNLCFFLSFS